MAVEIDGLIVSERDVFAGPQVFACFGALEAELGEAEMERMGDDAVGAHIENGDGHGSAGELAGPDFDLAV